MGVGGTQVRVFNAADGTILRTLDAYPGFGGGVWVAAGDVNDDGYADIVTGAGAGGGPHVRAFDGRSGTELIGFFAFAPAFNGGVRVAVGDVNGDGRADIIAGAGPGGAPEVRVFDGATGSQLNSVFAYAPTFTGGVFVATAVPLNRIAIDAPGDGSSSNGTFQVSGWAFEENAQSAGIDAVHVWAVRPGGGPTFLGVAAIGDARPDVAAAFGSQYGSSGYHLSVAGLAPGVYDITVFAHSTLTGAFNLRRTVRVTIAPPAAAAIRTDAESPGRSTARR
jgi:hypothetical protein